MKMSIFSSFIFWGRGRGLRKGMLPKDIAYLKADWASVIKLKHMDRFSGNNNSLTAVLGYSNMHITMAIIIINPKMIKAFFKMFHHSSCLISPK